MSVKSFAEVNVDIEPKEQTRAVELDPEAPFRILVMGDFSGKGSREWKPIEIDRDNFDEVMARVGPEFGGMQFRELDDFGPDAIYGQKAFQGLREAVRKPPAAAAAAEARPELRPGMSLLDSMLEAAEPGSAPLPPRPAARRGGMEEVVESIVAKYRVRAEDPAVARRQVESDAEAGECMRAVLHAPGFQALEAGWRALFGLVRAVETGSQLRIYLLDVGKAELAGGLKEGRLGSLLTEGEPWSVVAGNYVFGQGAEDAALLGKLAKAMSWAGAPFIAEADPGNAGDGVAWGELRQMSEARWIGLGMPRFLLRLPYGKKTVRVERFDFEEMPGVPEHGQYLWGNPAFLCVQVLAEAFSREGWDMRVGSNLEVAGLPLHVYEAEGEKQLKPCAEVLMTERDLEWVLDEGYVAVASVRGRDAVRVIRLQSIARPAVRLAGRWG